MKQRDKIFQLHLGLHDENGDNGGQIGRGTSDETDIWEDCVTSNKGRANIQNQINTVRRCEFLLVTVL